MSDYRGRVRALLVPVRENFAKPPAGRAVLYVKTSTEKLMVKLADGTSAEVGGSGGSYSAGTGLQLAGTVFSVSAMLQALHNLASAGLVARTGAGTAAARTIAAGSGQVTVMNGDGVSGNPTVDLAYASAVRESAGPTTLTLGAVSDGQYLRRVGSTIVGATVTAFVLLSPVINVFVAAESGEAFAAGDAWA